MRAAIDTAILRVSHTLPLVLKHDLLRLDADLKRYRALLAVALSHITAEP